MTPQPIFITSWDSIADNPDNVHISLIIKGVFDSDDEISSKACYALRNRQHKEDATPFMKRLIKHSRAAVRKTAVEILPDVSKSLALEYCPAIALADKDLEVCRTAFDIALGVLIDSRDQVTPRPIGLFSSLFRKQAQAKRESDGLSSFLVKATTSRREGIRLIAAQNLSTLRYRECPSHYFFLAERLSTDRAELVREKVTSEVAWMHHDKSLDLLRGALQDESAAVRESAVRGLSLEAWEKTPGILDALSTASKDVNIKIRCLAAQALAKAQVEPANDEQSIMLRIARNEWQGLEDFGVEAVEVICASPTLTREAEAVLVRIGSPALDCLIKLLEEPDWAVRRDAARIISKITDQDYLTALREKLANEKSGEVRFWLQKAVDACEHVGKQNAQQPR